MTIFAENAEPLVLVGTPEVRGRNQSVLRPDLIDKVRHTVRGRLVEAQALIEMPGVQGYLERQGQFAETHSPEMMEEIKGLAEGFCIEEKNLFAFVFLGAAHDYASCASHCEDGCSVWSLPGAEGGAWLGKNRDFFGADLTLQQVFLHQDPAWSGRRFLAVGSLGAPGAYSSGINADGLAIADTRISTRRHGIGWLRYFVMTKVLAECATVPEAVELIQSLVHAGGGSLVLADALGNMAEVELGRGAAPTIVSRKHACHTNHFVSGSLADDNVATDRDPMQASSQGRLATLDGWVSKRKHLDDPLDAVSLMGGHNDGTRVGLCRHGEDGDARTISGSLFDCRARTLYFCSGNPCQNSWRCYRI